MNANNYPSDLYQLDSKINNFENKLSNLSRIPGVGFVTGPLKIVIGLVQAITATILTAAYTFQGNALYKEYYQVHIKHGLGNMLAGVLETPPFVGFIIGLVRSFNEEPNIYYEDSTPVAMKRHGNKFMSYPTLDERDCVFRNCSDDESMLLQNRYQDLIIQYPQRTYAGLAKQAIEELVAQKNQEKSEQPEAVNPDRIVLRKVRDVKFGRRVQGIADQKPSFREGPDPLN